MLWVSTGWAILFLCCAAASASSVVVADTWMAELLGALGTHVGLIKDVKANGALEVLVEFL